MIVSVAVFFSCNILHPILSPPPSVLQSRMVLSKKQARSKKPQSSATRKPSKKRPTAKKIAAAIATLSAAGLISAAAYKYGVNEERYRDAKLFKNQLIHALKQKDALGAIKKFCNIHRKEVEVQIEIFIAEYKKDSTKCKFQFTNIYNDILQSQIRVNTAYKSFIIGFSKQQDSKFTVEWINS